MCCLRAGTAPGKVGSALEQSQCQGEPKGSKGFFHPKALFKSFRRAVRKEEHRPTFLATSWTAKPSREFPLGFQSCEAPERLEMMVMSTELQLLGVFWKEASFVLENKPRLCQTREAGVSPKPHLGRFCTFLGTNFSYCQRQLMPPGPGSGAPVQRFVPSVAMTFPEEERDFVRNKVGRTMNSLKLPH